MKSNIQYLRKSIYENLFINFLISLVILDIVFTIFIIQKIPYTEIDWKAYMQEVEGFLLGERNYMNIRGDTGPLVYPAGFLYIFSLLRWMTDHGTNIFIGQCIFAFYYILNLVVIFCIYGISILSSTNCIDFPIWTFVTLILSKRIHSIFVLRMFNDCIAILLSYIAVLLFTKQKWRIGCFIYSLAVSVKMNILLQAPGLLMLLLMANSIKETIICLAICGIVQLVLGWPFLSTFPLEYIKKSFEFDRVFMFKWTVNLKFLSEELFVSKELSILLLLGTILGMLLFAWKWISHYIQSRNSDSSNLKLSAEFITLTMFTSNFIGIAFARTLHYQFYCWYFHTLPFLLTYSLPKFATLGDLGRIIHNIICIAIMFFIEVSFNVYPAQWWSSLLLQGAHLMLLICLFTFKLPSPFSSSKKHTSKVL